MREPPLEYRFKKGQSGNPKGRPKKVDKEKEFKALDTPIKKKNFEEKTAKEFKLKEEAYMKLKVQKEEAVYNKIQEAAREVLIEQKLDTIVDFRIIFVGGIDVTDLVLQKLK